MLRRLKPISTASDDEQSAAPNDTPDQKPPSGIERRRHPRIKVDGSDAEDTYAALQSATSTSQDRRAGDRRVNEQTNYAGPERRSGDRRTMDTFRKDVQWTLAPEIENRILRGLGRSFPRSIWLRPSRILLLAIAIVAGGMAAFLAIQGEQEIATPTPQIIEIVSTQILVAKKTIGAGQRISPDSVEWRNWPEDARRSDYVTNDDFPDAITDMTGDIARFEFFEGEPIRAQKLVRNGQGYLSAVLSSGKRGVSISIAAEAASGGFITPNDRVDVVLTRHTALGQVSDTILSNVRVLAINSRLGEVDETGAMTLTDEQRTEVFSDRAIATLELSSSETEVIVGAANMGTFALVLRSMDDFGEPAKSEMSGTNQAIRLTSPFWNQSSPQGVLQ